MRLSLTVICVQLNIVSTLIKVYFLQHSSTLCVLELVDWSAD